jgi:predicted DNA-binding protein with PD1-like motif
VIRVQVGTGQEVVETVAAELGSRGVREAAIVSLIGAVDSCCLGTMTRSDARRDVLTEYHEPVELAGTGEVRDGRPHIHCAAAREGGPAHGGHLHWAKVETWFVNVYVEPL